MRFGYLQAAVPERSRMDFILTLKPSTILNQKFPCTMNETRIHIPHTTV